MKKKEFSDVKKFKFEWSDQDKFFRILWENFKTWRNLSKLLSEKLDWVEISPIWEFFQEFDKESLWNIDLELLDKYLNIKWDKIGSRGQGYYWLFWDMYLVDNRKLDTSSLDNVWNSFWKEYDEYISLLTNMESNDKLYFQYLDNYRNYVLLWSYILLMIEKSSNRYKTNPIKNMSLSIKQENIDFLRSKINELVKIYEEILDSMISFVWEWKIKKIEWKKIWDLHREIKKLFNKDSFIATKRQKFSLNNYFQSNISNTRVWFDKLFRNNREEDNLAIMFNLFLDTKNFKDKSISKLIQEERNRKKDSYILSSLYWGIELSLIAKYLWYEAWWANYSVYHLKQSDTYLDINDIFFPLTDEKLNWWKKVFILDDNIDSWDTLDKLRNMLQNNHIPVKWLVTARIWLSKEERKELKKYSKIRTQWRITKNNEVLFRLSKTKRLILSENWEYKIVSHNWNNSLSKEDIQRLYKLLVSFKWKNIDLSEIKKHIALNSYFIFPRVEKNNRKVNLLVAKKILAFRKKFWKEFRGL